MAKKVEKAENHTANKRRYPRVQFRNDMGQAHRILGARLVWNTTEVSDVFDLSFKGFAVSKPALVSLKKGALQAVRVELGEKPSFLVPVKVIWVRDQAIGLEIGDISAEAHLVLTEFLNDKLIGQNLRPVEKRYFGKNHDFDHWFQGPNGTHVFLWMDAQDPAKVTKVHLELDGAVWEFENRRVTKGEQLNVRAMQILGHIHSPNFQLLDVIEKVATLE